jgi:hypothetical protein
MPQLGNLRLKILSLPSQPTTEISLADRIAKTKTILRWLNHHCAIRPHCYNDRFMAWNLFSFDFTEIPVLNIPSKPEVYGRGQHEYMFALVIKSNISVDPGTFTKTRTFTVLLIVHKLWWLGKLSIEWFEFIWSSSPPWAANDPTQCQ